MVKKEIATKSMYYYSFIGHVFGLIFSSIFFKIALRYNFMVLVIVGAIFFGASLLMFIRFMRMGIYLNIVNHDEVDFGSVLKAECVKINEVTNLKKGIQRRVYFIEITGKRYFMVSTAENIKWLKELLLK